jgi:hypothetical protein
MRQDRFPLPLHQRNNATLTVSQRDNTQNIGQHKRTQLASTSALAPLLADDDDDDDDDGDAVAGDGTVRIACSSSIARAVHRVHGASSWYAKVKRALKQRDQFEPILKVSLPASKIARASSTLTRDWDHTYMRAA